MPWRWLHHVPTERFSLPSHDNATSRSDILGMGRKMDLFLGILRALLVLWYRWRTVRFGRIVVRCGRGWKIEDAFRRRANNWLAAPSKRTAPRCRSHRCVSPNTGIAVSHFGGVSRCEVAMLYHSVKITPEKLGQIYLNVPLSYGSLRLFFVSVSTCGSVVRRHVEPRRLNIVVPDDSRIKMTGNVRKM